MMEIGRKSEKFFDDNTEMKFLKVCNLTNNTTLQKLFEMMHEAVKNQYGQEFKGKFSLMLEDGKEIDE